MIPGKYMGTRWTENVFDVDDEIHKEASITCHVCTFEALGCRSSFCFVFVQIFIGNSIFFHEPQELLTKFWKTSLKVWRGKPILFLVSNFRHHLCVCHLLDLEI